MPYDPKLLNVNEQIAVDLHPHWMYFAWQITALVGAIVAAVVLSLLSVDAVTLFGVALVVIAAGWLGWRYLEWNTTHFVVTTDRVIYRSGVIAKKGVQIPLERVNNVNFSQGILERLVGAGDLDIESAGKDGQQHFEDVRHPDAVQNLIHAQMETNANRRFDRIAPMAGTAASTLPPPPPAADPAQQLERLKDLLDRGVITQSDFEAQKAKILDRM